MIAQISADGNLRRVMEELFTPEGNEIYLKSSSFYSGGRKEPVVWLDICAQASKACEVAIGIYSQVKETLPVVQVLCLTRSCKGKCTLNPRQDMAMSYTSDDFIIVVAESDDEYEFDD